MTELVAWTKKTFGNPFAALCWGIGIGAFIGFMICGVLVGG